jgi:hypothetical protein
MRSRYTKYDRKIRTVVFGFWAAIVLATFSYVVINPFFSYADAKYLSASVVDDSGATVYFSPGIEDATATFSLQKTGGSAGDSKIYDAKIVASNMPLNVSGKKIEISLPVGMIWVDDASSNADLKSQLDLSKGNNGIEKVGVDKTVLGYNFPYSGSRIYYIADGAVALAINVRVKVDVRVYATEIESAIKAKITVGNETEEGHLKVNVPTNYSTGGNFVSGSLNRYVKADNDYTSDFNSEKTIWFGYLNDAWYATQRLIKKVEIHFAVSNPAVQLKLTNTSSVYNLDTSDAANGNYVFSYNPEVANAMTMTMPYAVVVPSADSGITNFTVTET